MERWQEKLMRAVKVEEVPGGLRIKGKEPGQGKHGGNMLMNLAAPGNGETERVDELKEGH